MGDEKKRKTFYQVMERRSKKLSTARRDAEIDVSLLIHQLQQPKPVVARQLLMHSLKVGERENQRCE